MQTSQAVFLFLLEPQSLVRIRTNRTVQNTSHLRRNSRSSARNYRKNATEGRKSSLNLIKEKCGS